MVKDFDEIIRIAESGLGKVVPNTPVEVEEIEERTDSGHVGHYVVTFSYWARDTKPTPENPATGQVVSLAMRNESKKDLFNPWRKRFKRVEVDPQQNKIVAIRMYDPPIGAS